MGGMEPHALAECAACTDSGKATSLLLDRSQGSSLILQKGQCGIPQEAGLSWLVS